MAYGQKSLWIHGTHGEHGFFIHGGHSKQSSEFRRNLYGYFWGVASQDLIYKQQRAEGPMASLAQGNTLRT